MRRRLSASLSLSAFGCLLLVLVDIQSVFSITPAYEARRLAIVRRAQELALRKFSWAHVAERVERVLREAMHSNHTRAHGERALHTKHLLKP